MRRAPLISPHLCVGPPLPSSLLTTRTPPPTGSDKRYAEHEGEWVLDLVLDTIVGVTDAQEVDEQYESDASSCEFGEPDPYDQFRPLEIADFDVYDSDESWAAHREAVGLGHLNERIFPVLGP